MSERLTDRGAPPPEAGGAPAPEAERPPIPVAPPAHQRPSSPLHSGRAAVPPHPEDAHGFVAVLRRRDFRMLWAAQAASQLADKFLMFTLLVVLYDRTHHATEQALLMVAYTLPSVLLSAPAGVYADRHDKRSLMLWTNLLRGALILLIPLQTTIPHVRDQSWPLLVITVLFSSIGQVFAPAEAASIPFLVRREQIMVAMSLFMTTVIVTLVFGVPLATISLKVFGQLTPFYIATALFMVAALCVWLVGTSLRSAAAAHGPETDIVRELREGLVILGRSPALRIGLAVLTLSLVIVFTLFALGPAYMRTILHRSPDDTYLVLIPATIGMVGSAAVLGQSRRRLSRARALVWAMVLGGLTLVGIGLVPGGVQDAGWPILVTPAAVVLTAASGCALGALLIPAFTVLQERTDEDSRGRIFGGIFTVINAAVAVPLLLAGGLADAFGVDRVVAGLGGLLALIGATTWLRFGGALRVLDDPVPQPPAAPPAAPA